MVVIYPTLFVTINSQMSVAQNKQIIGGLLGDYFAESFKTGGRNILRFIHHNGAIGKNIPFLLKDCRGIEHCIDILLKLPLLKSLSIFLEDWPKSTQIQ